MNAPAPPTEDRCAQYAEQHKAFLERILSEAVNECIDRCAADPIASLINHLQMVQKQHRRAGIATLQVQPAACVQQDMSTFPRPRNLHGGYFVSTQSRDYAAAVALCSAPSNPRSWQLQLTHMNAELPVRAAHYCSADSAPLEFGWAQRLGARANPERALMPSEILRVGSSQRGDRKLSESEKRRLDEKRALVHLEMVLHLFDATGDLKPSRTPDGNTNAFCLTEPRIVDRRFVDDRRATEGSLAGFELNWEKRATMPSQLRCVYWTLAPGTSLPP